MSQILDSTLKDCLAGYPILRKKFIISFSFFDVLTDLILPNLWSLSSYLTFFF
jgi:hypothetical protein